MIINGKVPKCLTFSPGSPGKPTSPTFPGRPCDTEQEMALEAHPVKPHWNVLSIS